VEDTEQYDSITQDATDMSVFSVTLMPAMVRNHAQAQG
jgi:hypothetical protein